VPPALTGDGSVLYFKGLPQEGFDCFSFRKLFESQRWDIVALKAQLCGSKNTGRSNVRPLFIFRTGFEIHC
jgi:hypothetical protein